MSRTRALKFAELCLWAAGLATLGYCGFIWTKGWIAQRQGNRELDRSIASHQKSRSLEPGALIGRVEIPRLDVHAVIFEGTGDDELDRGVGHMQGTALPGDPGNVVLAAHRDTYFRGLRNVGDHDIITVSTPDGPRRYQVDSIRIVSPYDTAVAGPTPQPTLTLITCYPFEFFGHAPKRYIVQARELSETQAAVPVPPAAPKPAKTEAKPQASRVHVSAVRDHVSAPLHPVTVALEDAPVHMDLANPAPLAEKSLAEKPVAEKPAPAKPESDQAIPAATEPGQKKHKFGWINPSRLIRKIPRP